MRHKEMQEQKKLGHRIHGGAQRTKTKDLRQLYEYDVISERIEIFLLRLI